MNDLNGIALQLKSRDNYIIVGHVVPDGDCIGSLIGLYLGLLSIGKNVTMMLQDPVPPAYKYLVSAADIIRPGEPVNDKIIIYLDCTDKERVGQKVRAVLSETDITINIDHHQTNEFFAVYNYVNASASATAEIICELLQLMKITIDAAMATALYAGIVMDTGGFKYDNTTSRTLRTAAGLLDQGVDKKAIRVNLFESKPRSEILLLRLALKNLDFSDDGKIAWMTLPYQEMADLGLLETYPEEIINYARMIQGVEVGLLFRELKPGMVKIGFRSKSYIDVAELAAGFGGGGHKQAAGARLEGSLTEVKKRIIDKVRDVIN